MGRTIPTVRQSMEIIADKYGKMRKVMRREDAEILNEFLLMGRKHSPEISYGAIDPEIGFILSILIEMMKLIYRAENDNTK